MQRLNAKVSELIEFSFYDVTMMIEDDNEQSNQLSPSEIVPDKESNKMKLLCLQLSDKNVNTYIQLYENTPIYEVYELMVLQNAINYRLPDKKEY